jgi:hypothetical protein
MGSVSMQVFPADCRWPKPDWQRLRAELIQRGFMCKPSVRPVGDVTGYLWARIVEDRTGTCREWPLLRDLNAVMASLRSLGLVATDFGLNCSVLGVSGLVELLKERGWVSRDFEFPAFEDFAPGPLYWELSNIEPDKARLWSTPSIRWDDFGRHVQIACGQGLLAPPQIPGTDRVCEEWQDLLNRWYLDQSQQWIDPETGRGYGVLDLEWRNTLAAGFCWLEIQKPGSLDGDRAADLLSELTGRTYRYSYCYI